MDGQGHLDRPVQEEEEPRHDCQAQEIASSYQAEARDVPWCLIGCVTRLRRGGDARRHDAEDRERCRIKRQKPAGLELCQQDARSERTDDRGHGQLCARKRVGGEPPPCASDVGEQ